jgi:hypothetical protein
MEQIEVIAVFDVGKTNKKLFLYDHTLQIVFEKSVVLKEAVDEDNFPTEDIHALSKFVEIGRASCRERVLHTV